jgi:hypothetical protein
MSTEDLVQATVQPAHTATSATPLPWWSERRIERFQIQAQHRGPGSSFCVAVLNHWSDNAEKDAAFIVEAVNSHASLRSERDALLAALTEAKAAMIEIRHCSVAGAERGYTKPELWGDALFLSHGYVARALKTVDAALTASKATGERS